MHVKRRNPTTTMRHSLIWILYLIDLMASFIDSTLASSQLSIMIPANSSYDQNAATNYAIDTSFPPSTRSHTHNQHHNHHPTHKHRFGLHHLTQVDKHHLHSEWLRHSARRVRRRHEKRWNRHHAFIEQTDLAIPKYHAESEMDTSKMLDAESDNSTIHWPVKKEAIMEGDVILGGLMMVHSREDSMMCGPIMPQGGIQALEAMLYTLDRINEDAVLLPNITIGAHILDDCDRDSYGLEMAVDFIKGMSIQITANDLLFCP